MLRLYWFTYCSTLFSVRVSVRQLRNMVARSLSLERSLQMGSTCTGLYRLSISTRHAARFFWPAIARVSAQYEWYTCASFAMSRNDPLRKALSRIGRSALSSICSTSCVEASHSSLAKRLLTMSTRITTCSLRCFLFSRYWFTLKI